MTKEKECRCGKKFKLNGSLYNHIKSKHNGNQIEYKISNMKRGRPRKEKPPENNKQQNDQNKKESCFDCQGKNLINLLDSGLLDSISFRKLVCDFSEIHSNLINEKQIAFCNYQRAYQLYNDNQKDKIYIEIVGFVQMLLPEVQHKILNYILDELIKQKLPSYEIDSKLQQDITQIIKSIYDIQNKPNFTFSSSSPILDFTKQLSEYEPNTTLENQQL